MDPKEEQRVIEELMTPPDQKRMTSYQERCIAELMTGLQIFPGTDQMRDLMWRIGASDHAWEYRALNQRQATALMELMRRIAELAMSRRPS